MLCLLGRRFFRQIVFVLNVLTLSAASLAGDVDVEVGKTRVIFREANRPMMFRLRDGALIVTAVAKAGSPSAILSKDGGRTWIPFQSPVPVGHDGSLAVLADGTIVAIDYHTNPVAGKADTFAGRRWLSTDNWKTAQAPSPITLEMPNVVFGYDDGGKSTPVAGPKFVDLCHELPDGSLLTTMDTYFAADTKYTKYPSRGEQYKWRAVLVRSVDQGKSWNYVSTVACVDDVADPELRRTWMEGFNEPSLAVLPDGKLLCAMRTGTYVGTKEMETYTDLSQTIMQNGKYIVSNGERSRPIYLATSTDGGKTWSNLRPAPYAAGSRPRLLLLPNGVLALSYGRMYRPSQGIGIIFSTDGGDTWSKETVLSSSLSTGYSVMATLGPGKLLCLFDSVTAWGPKIDASWIGAVDIEVTKK